MSQTTRPRPADRPGQTLADVEQARTYRRVRWTVLGVVVVLLVGLGIAAVVSQRGPSSTLTTTGTASTALPRGVDPVTLAVPAAPGVTLKPGSPELYVWEDPQCPSCAAAEQATGPALLAMARSGDLRLSWRPTTFLDGRFPGQSSLRATAAWGCAVDAGKAAEFHGAMFAAQPSVEGAGYSDAALVAIARTSGIQGAGLTTFRSCVASGRYRSWAARSTKAFSREGVTYTPSGFLDGHELARGSLGDPAAVSQAIAAARTARAGG